MFYIEFSHTKQTLRTGLGASSAYSPTSSTQGTDSTLASVTQATGKPYLSGSIPEGKITSPKVPKYC